MARIVMKMAGCSVFQNRTDKPSQFKVAVQQNSHGRGLRGEATNGTTNKAGSSTSRMIVTRNETRTNRTHTGYGCESNMF